MNTGLKQRLIVNLQFFFLLNNTLTHAPGNPWSFSSLHEAYNTVFLLTSAQLILVNYIYIYI